MSIPARPRATPSLNIVKYSCIRDFQFFNLRVGNRSHAPIAFNGPVFSTMERTPAFSFARVLNLRLQKQHQCCRLSRLPCSNIPSLAIRWRMPPNHHVSAIATTGFACLRDAKLDCSFVQTDNASAGRINVKQESRTRLYSLRIGKLRVEILKRSRATHLGHHVAARHDWSHHGIIATPFLISY
jgi:hypothetical protein